MVNWKNYFLLSIIFLSMSSILQGKLISVDVFDENIFLFGDYHGGWDEVNDEQERIILERLSSADQNVLVLIEDEDRKREVEKSVIFGLRVKIDALCSDYVKNENIDIRNKVNEATGLFCTKVDGMPDFEGYPPELARSDDRYNIYKLTFNDVIEDIKRIVLSMEDLITSLEEKERDSIFRSLSGIDSLLDDLEEFLDHDQNLFDIALNLHLLDLIALLSGNMWLALPEEGVRIIKEGEIEGRISAYPEIEELEIYFKRFKKYYLKMSPEDRDYCSRFLGLQHESLFNIYNDLYGSTFRERKRKQEEEGNLYTLRVFKYFLHIGCILMDVYTICKVLHAIGRTNIIVFAGDNHTQDLKKMLIYFGFHHNEEASHHVSEEKEDRPLIALDSDILRETLTKACVTQRTL